MWDNCTSFRFFYEYQKVPVAIRILLNLIKFMYIENKMMYIGKVHWTNWIDKINFFLLTLHRAFKKPFRLKLINSFPFLDMSFLDLFADANYNTFDAILLFFWRYFLFRYLKSLLYIFTWIFSSLQREEFKWKLKVKI